MKGEVISNAFDPAVSDRGSGFSSLFHTLLPGHILESHDGQ